MLTHNHPLLKKTPSNENVINKILNIVTDIIPSFNCLLWRTGFVKMREVWNLSIATMPVCVIDAIRVTEPTIGMI